MGELGHQARWWAGEYRRRGIEALARVAPVAVRTDLVRALEARDAGRELTLDPADPFRASCEVERHLVAPAAQHVVPSSDDLPLTAGNCWPERYVHRLTACRVDLGTSLVFHAGRVLTASGGGWRTARDGAFLSGAGARAAATRNHWAGPIAPMGTAHNYYHLVVETLPRLLHVRAVAPQATPTFAAPMPPFAAAVLDALGIGYRVAPAPAAVRADDVWLCDPVPTNWPHPVDLDLLRSAVDAVVPPPARPGPRRLYVTRRRSGRPVVDEARVEEAVRDRGFAVVEMQDLPFADQVRAFRDADVVVAPHGAGLTNIVFCDPGTTVVELTTGDWWNPCYRNIASIAGLPYRLATLPWHPDAPHGAADDAIAGIDAALAGRPA